MPPEPPPSTAEELAAYYRASVLLLRSRTVRALLRAYGLLVDPEHLAATTEEFARIAATVVLAGQRAAVTLADAFVALVLSRETGLLYPARGVDPAPFLGLRDTDAPLEAVLASSQVFVRRALEQDRPEEEALAYGAHRAVRLGATEVVRAGADALAALADDSGLSPGWRRVTGPTACPVCAGLADGSLQPWDAEVQAHPHCSCVARPVVAS